jgi:hypothetical protein
MMPNDNLPERFKETEVGPIPVDWGFGNEEVHAKADVQLAALLSALGLEEWRHD